MSSAETSLVAALFDEYGPALYRYAYRYLQDRGRAEDAVQEVLLRAWRHPERLDPSTGSPRGWLFTVARNVLTDQWRADQARPRTVADERAVESIPTVDDVFDQLVEGWQVEEALAELSVEHRRVLIEVFYKQRSVAEAARALGIPAGTVKSRTHYALRTLKVALERKGLTR
jgi:RNA polymerase sigma-70 factor (ECF subfamily)